MDALLPAHDESKTNCPSGMNRPDQLIHRDARPPPVEVSASDVSAIMRVVRLQC